MQIGKFAMYCSYSTAKKPSLVRSLPAVQKRSFPTLCVYVYKERNQLCWLIKKRSCLLDWYCIHVLLPIQPGKREHTGPDLFASAGHVQKETRSSDWLRTPIGDWSFCCCTDRCSAAAVTYSLIGRFLHSSDFLNFFVPRCDI